jgi:hypothetical protein
MVAPKREPLHNAMELRIRLKVLSDMAAPMCANSRTDKADSFLTASTATEEPIRLIARRETDEPTLIKSSTEIDDPMREKALTANEDPNLTKSSTHSVAPMLIVPNIELVEPTRA